MPHKAVMAGVAREEPKSISSMACLAFVAILAMAFWAGALWFGNLLIQLLAA